MFITAQFSGLRKAGFKTRDIYVLVLEQVNFAYQRNIQMEQQYNAEDREATA